MLGIFKLYLPELTFIWRVKVARLCSHPICTRRGWWVRHLKPKTPTLETRKERMWTLSAPQNVIIWSSQHYYGWPSNCQWKVWHIRLQLQPRPEPCSTLDLSSSGMRSDCNLKHHFSVSVWALVLTELALLGLGHGRPVPGPLGGNTGGMFD